MGFQKQVNLQPAPGVEGDFCSANLRTSLLSGAGAFVVAATTYPVNAGVTVGKFAWGDQSSGLARSAYMGAATEKMGFVHREQQALITAFLSESGMTVQPGYPVTLMSNGEFWARFAAGATPGQVVYVNLNDGSLVAQAAGTTTTVVSFTGVIAVTTGILTASAVTGVLAPGQLIEGVGVPAGTRISAQLSGTAGAAGTYQTTTTTAVSSVAMTARILAATANPVWFVDSPAASGELAMISSHE